MGQLVLPFFVCVHGHWKHQLIRPVDPFSQMDAHDLSH